MRADTSSQDRPVTELLFPLQSTNERVLFVKDASFFWPGKTIIIANASDVMEYNMVEKLELRPIKSKNNNQDKLFLVDYPQFTHGVGEQVVQLNTSDYSPAPAVQSTFKTNFELPPDATDLNQYDINLSPCSLPGVPSSICIDWKKKYCGPDYIHSLFDDVGHVANPALWVCMDQAWGEDSKGGPGKIKYPQMTLRRPCQGIACLEPPNPNDPPFHHTGVYGEDHIQSKTGELGKEGDLAAHSSRMQGIEKAINERRAAEIGAYESKFGKNRNQVVSPSPAP